MPNDLFDDLRNRGCISDEGLAAIRNWYAHPKTNLFIELRTLLYIGVLLFTGGLGVFIYTHIEQLGHLTIVAILVLLLLGCLAWSAKVARPFAWHKVESPHTGYDYTLLLAGLLVPILAGYLQAQFGLFGNRWGLASFIPMVILFLLAYYFDHQGILSLAIGNLAAWLGITLKPQLLANFDLFGHPGLIITAFVLGLVLIAFAAFIRTTPYKPHFHDTYQQFGMHLSFLGALAGLMTAENTWPIWLLLLIATGAWHLRKSFSEKSGYYMIVAVAYIYVGISYVVSAKLLAGLHDVDGIYANLFYYLISGITAGMLVHRLHRKIKAA